MKIIKASSEKEEFSYKKAYYSILDAGASKSLARGTASLVKHKVHKDMTTEEIFKIIINNLKKEPGIAEKYNLKRAIMSLGPAGYAFETYFSEILNAYGYKTQVGIHIKGKRIIHEVDVIAEKDTPAGVRQGRKKKFMIECKYHNEKGIHTRLQPALAAYARFLDLEKNQKIDQPWLVTNTKCTSDATNYAKGVGLKITSWRYPRNESLAKLIEKKNLYPITMLFLDEPTKRAFLDNHVVMLKSLIELPLKELSKRTKIPIRKLELIKKKAKGIIG